MSTSVDGRAAPRLNLACHALAVALTVAWCFALVRWLPRNYVDESGHLGNVYHFLEAKAGWPGPMPMLPGYHFVISALWQLHPPCSLLTLCRIVTAAGALLALAAFARGWRAWNGGSAGAATLLFALLPLWQPFTGLAYTEATSLGLLLAALTLQFGGHLRAAGLAFLAACVVRQTNLVWVAFVVLLELGAAWDGIDLHVREAWHRTRWLVLLLAAGTAGFLLTGRVSVGTETGTTLAFNPASLHGTAALLLLLGLPVWLGALPDRLRRLAAAARRHPRRTRLAVPAFLGAVALVTLTFRNSHVWNQELRWDGETFTLLRNWPLVGAERFPALRVLSSLNVVVMALALVGVVRTSPRPLVTALAVAIGLLPALMNDLVEPRYVLPGLVIVLLLAPPPPGRRLALGLWWAALSLLHAPFILTGRSLW